MIRYVCESAIRRKYRGCRWWHYNLFISAPFYTKKIIFKPKLNKQPL